MDSLKYESLLMNIRKYESIAVAFSGGVDSTLLLKAAHDELGERAAAITVESSVLSQNEALEAEEFCKQYGIRHIIMNFDVLSIPEFSKNPKDRCYHCKKALFSEIKNTAMKNGFSVVAEGENADDVNDYRPGMKVIKELDIKSPLKDAGLTKADIRMISHKLGLSTWDKPSYACLATRDTLWRIDNRRKAETDRKIRAVVAFFRIQTDQSKNARRSCKDRNNSGTV